MSTKFCIKYNLGLINENMSYSLDKLDYLEFNNNELYLRLINSYVDIDKNYNDFDFKDKMETKFSIIYYLIFIDNNNIKNIFDIIDCKYGIEFIFIFLNDINLVIDNYFENINKLVSDDNSEEILEDNERKYIENVILSCDDFGVSFINYLLIISENLPKILLNETILNKFCDLILYYLDLLLSKNSDGERKSNKLLIFEEEEKYFYINAKINLKTEKLVNKFTEIFINIYEKIYSKDFLNAIVENERSFSVELLDLLENSIYNVISFRQQIFFTNFKDTLISIYNDKKEDIDYPDEFLDPLYFVPIINPVVIPGSNIIMERKIIERHLMSSNENPFDRSKLDLQILNEYNLQESSIKLVNEFINKIKIWKNGLKDKN